MAELDGWIKIHRKITGNWIWEDPVKLKMWLDLLLITNHADHRVNIGLQLVDCKRGQTIMSLSSLASRWKISKGSARNFLSLLEKDKMITHESLTKTTRITICNYGSYQDAAHDGETLGERSVNARKTLGERSVYTNKNDKKNKNEKNEKNRESVARERAAHLNEDFQKRKEKFKEDLTPFIETYGRDMLNAFFNYWTEPNKSKTKMGFELQRTWDTSRRLASWAAREERYIKSNKGTRISSFGKLLTYSQMEGEVSAANPQDNYECVEVNGLKLWKRK